MREIIFKGKKVDNGEWAEGYYAYCTDGNQLSHRIYISFAESYGTKILSALWFEVIPETVSQYTGLEDKNGKKIFEGDIITVDNGIGYKARVYFDDGGFRRVPIHAGEASSDLLYYLYESKDYEIIGNIHDNPELLGGN